MCIHIYVNDALNLYTFSQVEVFALKFIIILYLIMTCKQHSTLQLYNLSYYFKQLSLFLLYLFKTSL